MEIKCLVTGAFETNTYLLKLDNKYIIIDPSGRCDKLIKHLEGDVVGVLLTHGHFDHIKAVDDLYKIYHMDIYLGEEDFVLVDPKTSKLYNRYLEFTGSIKSPIKALKEGKMQIGPFNFEVVSTKGHTKGSHIFIFDDVIFTGDTLFKNSVGRTDLYGGNAKELKESLRYFKELDKDYTLYPGHEDATLLSIELLNNPFLV